MLAVRTASLQLSGVRRCSAEGHKKFRIFNSLTPTTEYAAKYDSVFNQTRGWRLENIGFLLALVTVGGIGYVMILDD
jgi:hypothetical protein